LAPGKDIFGAAIGGGVIAKTGTSFAAPVVAGAAGLLLALQIELGLPVDPAQVRDVLLRSSVKCTEGEDSCRQFLSGNLNLVGAANLLAKERLDMSSASSEHQAEGIIKLQGPIASGEPEFQPSGEDGLPSRATILPSSCSCPSCQAGGVCSCGGQPALSEASTTGPVLIYALGKLGVDFGTDSRRDSIAQFMAGKDPNDPEALLDFLEGHPEESERVIWTLNVENNPRYTIQPAGAYAHGGYEMLVDGLKKQLAGTVVLFGVPGMLSGKRMRLLSGLERQVITPAIRGLTEWTSVADLVHSKTGYLGTEVGDLDRQIKKYDEEIQTLKGDLERASTDEGKKAIERAIRDAERKKSKDQEKKETAQEQHDALNKPGTIQVLTEIFNMIVKKYDNLGIRGPERALNYTSFYIYAIMEAIVKIAHLEANIDEIIPIRSLTCRPGSECYDVDFTLFKPSDITAALHVLRLTVDVSDVIPFLTGTPYWWTKRP
jgi:hypothetical protein